MSVDFGENVVCYAAFQVDIFFNTEMLFNRTSKKH